MDMNWLDFLDVLDCYCRDVWLSVSFAKAALPFKRLFAEAWYITLNSWRKSRSYVLAVRFNYLNQKYTKTLPMTVDILNRELVSPDEEKLYREKEQKILYEKIIEKYRDNKNW